MNFAWLVTTQSRKQRVLNSPGLSFVLLCTVLYLCVETVPFIYLEATALKGEKVGTFWLLLSCRRFFTLLICEGVVSDGLAKDRNQYSGSR